MIRSEIARRLADLVDDDEALASAVAFLESCHARRSGSGSRMVWHLDRAGRVRAVEINAGIYQAS